MPHSEDSRDGTSLETVKLVEILLKKEFRYQLSIGLEYPNDRIASLECHQQQPPSRPSTDAPKQLAHAPVATNGFPVQ